MPTEVDSLDFKLGWWDGIYIPIAMGPLLAYAPGEDRATGYLYGDGAEWPPDLATAGPKLLDDLERATGIRFTHVVFQAYRNGSGCDWHADTPFDAQAILSLGATRKFGIRPIGGEPEWLTVNHGDLVFMPSGFQDTHEHCVPVEPDKPGERVSLVFRTPRS
jgi:alkylated DNA repair dioxygenase AlkB